MLLKKACKLNIAPLAVCGSVLQARGRLGSPSASSCCVTLAGSFGPAGSLAPASPPLLSVAACGSDNASGITVPAPSPFPQPCSLSALGCPSETARPTHLLRNGAAGPVAPDPLQERVVGTLGCSAMVVPVVEAFSGVQRTSLSHFYPGCLAGAQHSVPPCVVPPSGNRVPFNICGPFP